MLPCETVVCATSGDRVSRTADKTSRQRNKRLKHICLPPQLSKNQSHVRKRWPRSIEVRQVIIAFDKSEGRRGATLEADDDYVLWMSERVMKWLRSGIS